MLEEDAIRFDTFLKENDKKAHEAIKEAEAKSKLKQEKVFLINNNIECRIKKITTTITNNVN